jgi:hypothetical protein
MTVFDSLNNYIISNNSCILLKSEEEKLKNDYINKLISSCSNKL